MRGRAAFQRSRRGDYCGNTAPIGIDLPCRTKQLLAWMIVGGRPDRDCLLLLTHVITLDITVDSGYKSVYRCIQSLQCRKLHQTAGHLTMC